MGRFLTVNVGEYFSIDLNDPRSVRRDLDLNLIKNGSSQFPNYQEGRSGFSEGVDDGSWSPENFEKYKRGVFCSKVYLSVKAFEKCMDDPVIPSEFL